MDINTITMDRHAAWSKASAYKERLAQMKPSLSNAAVRAEYETALKGFEALSKGAKLIDLNDVMAKCPLDHSARPKIAIARHDRKQVKFEWSPHTSKASFHTDFGACREDCPLETLTIRVNMSREQGQTRRVAATWASTGYYNQPIKVEGYALVPMIPLDVRPKTGIPEGACILWEVEKWADSRLDVAPGAITGSCGWRFDLGGVPSVNRKTTNRPKWSRSTPPWISLLRSRSPGQRPGARTS